ncbi:MAG: undecaprenyldiphospho-muramoylpentapeptide beta-N-acetylglucosaminyltransferase [Gammaproteobacteria bacterium]
MSGLRILIMAGGTGGHVFPALAVARELRERGHEVSWLGTQRGLEAELVPQAGFPIDYISIAGLRGKGLTGWLLAPWRLSVALFQALAILRRRRPAMVLGMGGFVTGPGGVMAKMFRIPLIIHEQNAVPGMTNRLLSRIANQILESFPGSFDGGKRDSLVGNPVRADIWQLPEPERRMKHRGDPLHLLILGGSLGAQALNENVPAALGKLDPALQLEVRHQAGRGKDVTTLLAYKSAGIDAQVVPFISNMAEAYSWADLVICRAGALTISELAAAGVGSILVPYPYAVDDHQTLNASYLADAGAALLIPESTLGPAALAGILKELLGDRGKLLQMAQTARHLAKPMATLDVADICEEMRLQ